MLAVRQAALSFRREAPDRSRRHGSESSRTEPADRSPGFTLIELLVVLVILGVCAGYFVVNYAGITEKERIKSAARILDGIYKSLRTTAVFQGIDINSDFQVMLQLHLAKARYRQIVPPRQDAAGRFVIDGEVVRPDDLRDILDKTPWRDLPRDVYIEKIWTGPNEGFEWRSMRDEPVNIKFLANGTVQQRHILVYRSGKQVISADVNMLTAAAEFYEEERRFPEVDAAQFKAIRTSK